MSRDAQTLMRERARLANLVSECEQEIVRLHVSIEGIDFALSCLATDKRRLPHGVIKETVLDVMNEHRELSARDVVRLSEERGCVGVSQSISSLLSRLKRDGTLLREGNKYRVKGHAA